LFLLVTNPPILKLDSSFIGNYIYDKEKKLTSAKPVKRVSIVDFPFDMSLRYLYSNYI